MTPADLAARAMLAMEAAGRGVRALAARDIDVMPLKGVLFLALGVRGSETRYVGDVDLLVREAQWVEALIVLERVGFREVARVPHARTLWHDELAFHVDLHHRLFPRGWFRMETADVFARGTEDAERFGARVTLMDPYDLYAHLVGHFVVGRHNAADTRHVDDFAAVTSRFGLSAVAAARRLREAGLARAARYVLRETDVGSHAPHARTVLAELPPDHVGDALGLLAHGVLARWSRRARAAAVVAHFYAL